MRRLQIKEHKLISHTKIRNKERLLNKIGINKLTQLIANHELEEDEIKLLFYN